MRYASRSEFQDPEECHSSERGWHPCLHLGCVPEGEAANLNAPFDSSVFWQAHCWGGNTEGQADVPLDSDTYPPGPQTLSESSLGLICLLLVLICLLLVGTERILPTDFESKHSYLQTEARRICELQGHRLSSLQMILWTFRRRSSALLAQKHIMSQ